MSKRSGLTCHLCGLPYVYGTSVEHRQTPEHYRALILRRSLRNDADCWVWQGPRTGRYGAQRYRGKSSYSHRVAYEAFVGPIPPGLHIDHLCRNTLCVNPAHLEPVSCRENLLRGEGLTGQQARRTACPRGHEYDATYAYSGRTHRVCRRCHALHERERRARVAAAVGGHVAIHVL